MVKQLTAQEKYDLLWNDFELFAKTFIKITDNENEVVPFEINDAQRDLEKLAKKNKYILVGKARQSGISTYVLGRALWRALTKPNENILIVSYKGDSAKALFDKLKSMNDLIPRDEFKGVFPSTKRDNRGELKLSNGSSISSVTAGTKSVGRGSTYTYIHCSEYSFWNNQENQLLSLEQSLGKGENSQITIETTSNGINNHFFKLYTAAMKGDSKYVSYFVPWYHPLYKKQFRYDHQQAMEWYKSNNKGKRLSKVDLDIDEIPLFEAGANLNMIAWKRWKILDMESENQFFQEYPANAMQSFISTGNSVFQQQMVLKRLGNLMPPLSREDVVNDCEDFPEYLVRFIGKGLSIWQLPKPNERYYGGADTSSGSGQDSSTIAVYNSESELCFTFDSNKTPVYEFAEILNDLGKLFNYVFYCIERNSYGLPVIERMRKEYQYLNLYKAKIFNERGQKQLQLGWTTTSKSKAILISDFKEQFELAHILIDCEKSLSQMQMYIEDSGGRMGNKKGSSDAHHDDLVIANALAIQAIKANKWYV